MVCIHMYIYTRIYTYVWPQLCKTFTYAKCKRENLFHNTFVTLTVISICIYVHTQNTTYLRIFNKRICYVIDLFMLIFLVKSCICTFYVCIYIYILQINKLHVMYVGLGLYGHVCIKFFAI